MGKLSFHNIFPVQSRESEIENAVHNVVNHIINNSNEFSVVEQVHIINTARERVREVIGRDAADLAEELNDYKEALGLL